MSDMRSLQKKSVAIALLVFLAHMQERKSIQCFLWAWEDYLPSVAIYRQGLSWMPERQAFPDHMVALLHFATSVWIC